MANKKEKANRYGKHLLVLSKINNTSIKTLKPHLLDIFIFLLARQSYMRGALNETYEYFKTCAGFFREWEPALTSFFFSPSSFTASGTVLKGEGLIVEFPINHFLFC